MDGLFTMIPEPGAVSVAARVSIGPLLKQAGYRKKALRFYRESGDILHLIEIQVSRFDENSFTYNLAVFDAKAWECVWSKVAPRYPGPEDCFPALRIGQLLTDEPEGALDKWWQANEVVQVQESVTKLEVAGLPVLNGFKSRHDVARWAMEDVQGPPSLVLLAAATCVLAGQTQKADIILDRLEKAQLKAWQPLIEKVRGLIST